MLPLFTKKHPVEAFIKACNHWHEDVLSKKFIVATELMNHLKVSGITYLLWEWNRPWSLKFSNEEILSQVREAVNDTTNKLQDFSEDTLSSLDFSYKKNQAKIMTLYEEFRKREAINKTGASKALHLLNPRLFVMWDKEIRQKYHTNYFKDTHQGHQCASKECYLSFLQNCQQIIRKLFNQGVKKDAIIQKHRKSLPESIQNLHKVFEYKESLAKMIDEYNWQVLKKT